MRSNRYSIMNGLLATLLAASSPAHALLINANFGSSITSNINATQVENAILQAIGTFDGLYSNAVTIAVNFTYSPAAAGNLLSTTQYYEQVSYKNYVTALKSDSAANPNNTLLATAIANLSQGNDANGITGMVLADGLYKMLGFGTPNDPMPVININSIQNFSFNQPAASTQYDLVAGLEHELDEALSGGDAGSTLNNQGNGFFAGRYGPLDLYRYSAPSTGSWSTSLAATSYFSVDGGTTDIVGFNQKSGGDFGDFGPQCGTNGKGGAEYIQNAFNCKGPQEAYTTASPEFAMLESIGWDPLSSSSSAPEPGTYSLMIAGLALLGIVTRRRNIGLL